MKERGIVVRAGGGIVEDVDGNRLIDLGSGIAVTTIGNSAPRVVDAVPEPRSMSRLPSTSSTMPPPARPRCRTR
ncbi:hypothetical protein MAHJHV55_54770 [Mycobacterium avium subsp. hominissuis]